MHAQVSMLTRANNLGLDYPCPDIEEFFNFIFDDQHMVEFVQRLLGYDPEIYASPRRAMAWQAVRIREISQDVHQNVEFVDPDDE